MSEFVCLCTLIETRGILKVIIKKEARLSKVSLQWDQEVLTDALQDKDLTSDIINDISCL
jgi:cell division control protein 6